MARSRSRQGARRSTADAAMGLKKPRSPVLAPAEVAVIVGSRRHTLPPPDDGLYGLKPPFPHLARSSLRRGPGPGTASAACRRWKAPSAGMSASPMLALAASTSTSKRPGMSKAKSACSWPSTALRSRLSPSWTLKRTLTDNGVQFRPAAGNRSSPIVCYGRLMLNRICHDHGIERCLTQSNHP